MKIVNEIKSETEKGTPLFLGLDIPSVEEMTLAKSYREMFRKGEDFFKTIFFLDSPYRVDDVSPGWPSAEDRKTFEDSVFQVFSKAGWEIESANNTCMKVSKSLSAYLYLHPMEFSGEVRKDVIPEVENLIEQIQSVKLRSIKLFRKTYPFYTESQLMRFIRENRELFYWWIILQFEKKIPVGEGHTAIGEMLKKIRFFDHGTCLLHQQFIAEQRMLDMFYALVDVGDIKLYKNGNKPFYKAKSSKWKLVKDRS